MPQGIKLQKAYFVNRLTSTVIPVQYNPAELAFKKSVPWSADDTEGKNVPRQDFKKGDPTTLSLKLDYDTSGADGSGQMAADVRTQGNFQDLMDLAWAVTGGSRTQPPLVDFAWGAAGLHSALVGVIKSINVTYTRFNPDGVPTRANVQVEMMEVDPTLSEYSNHGGGGTATMGAPPAEQEIAREVRMALGR
jgi:hypothetical protein